MEELREYLLDQDIWEREVDELLGNFNDNATEDDLHIVAIFDSAYDLASNYIDNVIGELDHQIWKQHWVGEEKIIHQKKRMNTMMANGNY